jgi:hypothetical protein
MCSKTSVEMTMSRELSPNESACRSSCRVPFITAPEAITSPMYSLEIYDIVADHVLVHYSVCYKLQHY